MQKNLPVLAAISFLLVIGAFSGCSETPTDPLPPPGDSASLASLYDERPNVDNCFEGRLKQAEREKVLAYVNAIRRLHGLEDVEYRAADDIQTAKASLIIAANSTLTHQPTASMRCYTQEGYDGSSTSNIGFRSGETPSSESFIDMWLVDNGVASLGHRRWIIDPFLRHISFGRVDRTVGGMFAASVLKVIYAEQRDISSSSIDYVAYPYHDYPARLLPAGADVSLTVIVDRASKSSNRRVDFSGATASITAEGGGAVGAQMAGSDAEGYGVPNVVRIAAPGLQPNVRYNVTVRNVVFEGTARDYEWWFRLVP